MRKTPFPFLVKKFEKQLQQSENRLMAAIDKAGKIGKDTMAMPDSIYQIFSTEELDEFRENISPIRRFGPSDLTKKIERDIDWQIKNPPKLVTANEDSNFTDSLNVFLDRQNKFNDEIKKEVKQQVSLQTEQDKLSQEERKAEEKAAADIENWNENGYPDKLKQKKFKMDAMDYFLYGVPDKDKIFSKPKSKKKITIETSETPYEVYARQQADLEKGIKEETQQENTIDAKPERTTSTTDLKKFDIKKVETKLTAGPQGADRELGAKAKAGIHAIKKDMAAYNKNPSEEEFKRIQEMIDNPDLIEPGVMDYVATNPNAVKGVAGGAGLIALTNFLMSDRKGQMTNEELYSQ